MKPAKNDVKAPRMKKGKYSTQVVTRDIWKEFVKKYPEYKDMKWETFYGYWQHIAEVIRTESITNPLGVKLGSYTGELKLQYLPYKMEENYNYTASSEAEDKTPHTNILSKGKIAKIKWERRWAVRFNSMLQFFAFEPIREMKKLAKDHVDNNSNSIRVSRITVSRQSRWRNKI